MCSGGGSDFFGGQNHSRLEKERIEMIERILKAREILLLTDIGKYILQKNPERTFWPSQYKDSKSL